MWGQQRWVELAGLIATIQSDTGNLPATVPVLPTLMKGRPWVSDNRLVDSPMSKIPRVNTVRKGNEHPGMF